MKLIAINGSPRKNWNTYMLLEKALEGAKAFGAETELINLYDLDYKGCIACLACKRKNSQTVGHCTANDELRPILDSINNSDGLIIGSPVYLADITAMTRAFLERLIFQYISYDEAGKSYFDGSLKTAFIYMMNVAEDVLEKAGYNKMFEKYEIMLNRFFEYKATVISTETLQVDDYDKFHMARFNETDRKNRRKQEFPKDCEKAYDLGKNYFQAD